MWGEGDSIWDSIIKSRTDHKKGETGHGAFICPNPVPPTSNTLVISKAFAALGAAVTPRSPALGTAPGPLRLCLEQRREGEEKTEEERGRGERRRGKGQD